MAAETLQPDSIISSANIATQSLTTNYQDDPEDGGPYSYNSWDGNGDTDVRLSFQTPTGSPTVGADLQTFKARVKRDGSGTNNADYSLEVWETGGTAALAVIATGTVTSTGLGGELLTGTFNASILGTSDGSAVEFRLIQTNGGGGSPSARSGLQLSGVEWDVEYTAGASPIAGSSAGTSTASGTLAGTAGAVGSSAGTSTAAGTVGGDGELIGASAGTSTALATLGTTPSPIVGSSAGTSTASGTLAGTAGCVGASAGAATCSGTLSGAASCVGSSAGTSTVSGVLVGLAGIVGASAGTSTASGALAGTAVCVGTTAGTSTASGTLAGTASCVGSSAGASTCTGTLAGTASCVGTSAGTSTAGGTVTDASSADPIVGSSAGTSSVTGTLSYMGGIFPVTPIVPEENRASPVNTAARRWRRRPV